MVAPPSKTTWAGNDWMSTRPIGMPPVRLEPNAALRAAAACEVRVLCTRTTQVPTLPGPRRRTRASERLRLSSRMLPLPTLAVRKGLLTLVRTVKSVTRTVVPPAEKARPPSWSTVPAAVSGLIRPPSIGKLTRRPLAVAGPTGATLTPRSRQGAGRGGVEVEVGLAVLHRDHRADRRRRECGAAGGDGRRGEDAETSGTPGT